jgi:hypothetical protein
MTYENLQAKTDVLISVYENIHKHIRKMKLSKIRWHFLSGLYLCYLQRF